MAPFNAPAVQPTANPVPTRCHSWRYFKRHVYTNPCSNGQNFRTNFYPRYAADRLHGSQTPQSAQNDFLQHTCADAAHSTPNGTAHPICRYCIAATEAEQWFRTAQTYFVAAQPHDSHSNVSRHFLTRLCRVCEEREMRLLHQRERNDNAIRPPDPTAAQQAAMVDWPLNSCTCKKAALDPGIRCRPHRREHYNNTIPELNDQRVANREWLRKVELDANGTAVLLTDPDEIRRLEVRREGNRRPGRPQRPRLMRACRCGADPVDDVRRAQVLLCMFCEGIVHVDEPELDPLPLDPTTPRPLLSMNSHTTPNLFRLQRF
jgi:hypothetical protein